MLPLPVLPLEHEAGADQRGAAVGIFLLIALLVLGLLIWFISRRFVPKSIAAILFVLIGSGALLVWLPNRHRDAIIGEPRLPHLPNDGVLDYRRPSNRSSDPACITQSIGLFLIGLAGGPFVSVALGTLSPSLGFGVFAAAILMACVPGVRPLGAGILTGIGVAFLILLGICGGLIR